MKAARVYGPGKIVVEEVPVPVPGESDVLIKVMRTGICGTDVGVLHGYVPAKLPVTLGHEFSGTVAALGRPGLGGLKVGDSVCAAGGWGCGECQFCRRAMARFCRQRRGLGRSVDGSFAEYVRVDHRVVWRLPSEVTFDEGQNFLNIACVVRGLKKAPHQLAARAVIFGPGNIGLIMTQVLALSGASEVIMVGTRDSRLAFARQFGAKHILNSRHADAVADVLRTWPDGADLAVEASGNAICFGDACQVVGPGGVVVSIGVFSTRIRELDLSPLYAREITVHGSNGGEDAYLDALQLLADRKLHIIPMITHRFPIEETDRAFAAFEDKAADALRIVIEPSP